MLAPSVMQPKRVTKRKQWSNDVMLAALDAVKMERSSRELAEVPILDQPFKIGPMVHGTKEYFRVLKDAQDKNGLMNQSGCIYKC